MQVSAGPPVSSRRNDSTGGADDDALAAFDDGGTTRPRGVRGSRGGGQCGHRHVHRRGHAHGLRAEHDVSGAQGDTTIDAVAAEDVSANDITLDLYDPAGKLLVHGDTLTSPETVHYASDDLVAGTYQLQVCPFVGGTVSAPYDYAGSYSTTDGPVRSACPARPTPLPARRRT